MSDLLQAQVAGYAYGLTGPVDGVSEEIAAEAYSAAFPVSGRPAIEAAFARGVLDAIASPGADYGPDSDRYLSLNQAAARRGVHRQTISRILNDAARRARIFPGAARVGEGRRATWVLVADEVDAWTPAPTDPRRGRLRGVR